jgi:Spy/CpxP family protein refolding chaperone
MKTWIKRTLFGLAGLGVVFGSLAACSHRYGYHGGAMTEADATQWRERMVDRAAKELELDAAQKQSLTALAEQLRQQRQALMAGTPEPRAELKALIAGAQFDVNRANALVAQKTEALRTGSPAVITAAATFYDGLRPEQQQKVREFLNRAGHGRHGG